MVGNWSQNWITVDHYSLLLGVIIKEAYDLERRLCLVHILDYVYGKLAVVSGTNYDYRVHDASLYTRAWGLPIGVGSKRLNLRMRT